MTFITEAIRAAEEWAARLPKLPEPSGEDVSAQLRALSNERQAAIINIIVSSEDSPQ